MNFLGEHHMSLNMNAEDFKLTMEQEFLLVRYNQQITEVSQEELRTALLEITRQMMIKDNLIRTLVKAGI
jgi:Phycobilisome degradation protein nblA